MREYEYNLFIDHNLGKYVGEVPELGIRIEGDDPNDVNGDIKTQLSYMIEAQIIRHEEPTEGYITVEYFDKDNYENWNIPQRGDADVYYACTVSSTNFDEWCEENWQKAEQLKSKYGKDVFYQILSDRSIVSKTHFLDRDAIWHFNSKIGNQIGLSSWKCIDAGSFYHPSRRVWKVIWFKPLQFPHWTGTTTDNKYYFVSDTVKAILKERKKGESLHDLCDRIYLDPDLKSLCPHFVFPSQRKRAYQAMEDLAQAIRNRINEIDN